MAPQPMIDPRWILIAATLLAASGSVRAADAPAETIRSIPAQRGLVMTSALRSDQGDRENVVTIDDQSPSGVTYRWNTRLPGADGKPEPVEFRRFVRAIDLEKATRLHSVYWTADRADYPGYTGWSLSTAVYDALLGGGEVPYRIVTLDRQREAAQAVVSGLLRSTRRLRGSLRLLAQHAAPFPVLYDGRRVTVPARRVGGRFAADGPAEDVEFWVLADRAHPLLLKSLAGDSSWQMVRIDTPRADPVRSLEQQLSRHCRVELPGIYFAFGTADLDAQSQRTLVAVARLLGAHPEWTVAVEGHTDSVGSDAANLQLSRARAEAVRTSLASRHAVPASRIAAVGHGETRPREPNETFEGRARNRRVELVRPCSSREGNS